MANWRRIITELKKQQRHLAAQLTSIRTAISSLEFGSSGVPASAIIETPPHTAPAKGSGNAWKSSCTTVAPACRSARRTAP